MSTQIINQDKMPILNPTTDHTTPKNPVANASQIENLKVIRRNGTIMAFNRSKIAIALTKAFLDEEGGQAAMSSRVHELVEKLTNTVCESLLRHLQSGSTVHIEDIQDKVELALMRAGEHKVARSYVLYREEHRKAREAKLASLNALHGDKILNVTLENGEQTPLDISKLEAIVNESCLNLSNVQTTNIIKDTLKNLFDGVHILDVRRALIMTARTFIETEPNYSFVAARLLLNNLRLEVTTTLNLPTLNSQQELAHSYGNILRASVDYGIKVNRLDSKLKGFDFAQLGAAINAERDFNFTYLGLQTLYDRYFLHELDAHYELPQTFFMRVAMGLALSEQDKNARAIEFYNVLSKFDFMSSTPTLFNSGTIKSQLSSCYLSTIPDDLSGIYNGIRDNALLQKFAGGIGNDWTPVRGIHALIKGTNGKSQGVIPFMKVANDTAVAVNQGGKRKGAVCAYLETWHMDVEEFLELRKNTGDDRRRTHDMNTANWIPDLFMKRVIENKEWTLFSPDEVPDLHDLYGASFEQAYVAYEGKAAQGKIRNFKRIPAINLWRKMLGMLFETGHPWITFKDVCNLRSPQQHVGVVHSSNLCTEITLNTSEDEIAVCNLGSINLPQHIRDGKLDTEKLQNTINTAVRMLDNVIDLNYYSVKQARRSNMLHRPVGMGIMGFQDALYMLNISYQSNAAVEFADRSMEYISYYAILASTNLAEERGVYESFEGSLWSKGILPIDSINNLQETRGAYLDQDRSQTLDWQTLRTRVCTVGMRNSNVMAIAPTATISNICGVSQSIEPTYQNLFVKSNLSGEFTIVNTYLVDDLKALDLWDPVMINDLKYFNGSVQQIDRMPAALKTKYATAFEIDAQWLIDAASRRQKWIDQAQSLNLYIAQPSGKKLDSLYRAAWLRGLKTLYYLRCLGATDAEKSTIHTSNLNAVKTGAETIGVNACSIENPDCEACQ